MEENNQNATLMTTSMDDEGHTILTYIPLSIDASVVGFFAKNGTCTNKEIIEYVLDCDESRVWNSMWETFMKDAQANSVE